MKVASLFSGCGALDYGLTQAGHEIALQTESEPAAREVLAARFQGICQPREPSEIERLPNDVDLLVASVMDAELEGSWRESWSKDSVASKLKQVLRLMKTSPVAWVLVEAPAALLESDSSGGTETVPVVCDLVSEFERLGYRWAHRTIAAAAFGVPDLKPRVFLVGSRHGDPRALLFAEDAGVPDADVASRATDDTNTNGGVNTQAFVFNKRETNEGGDGRMRVFSDVVEGFYPGASSCALTPDGALAPMEVHDAERMQGLPPGWTLTARPGSSRTTGVGTGNGLVTDVDRWRALASSLGCVPAARWIGAKLASPYAAPFDASAATAFEAAAITPWPSAAFNTGDGRTCVRVSPFPCRVDVLPTLGAFISGAGASGSGSARSAVSKETVLECVDAMRRAGWQPPPPLVAVEVAAHAERTAAGAGAGERAAPAAAARGDAAAALGPAASAMPPAYGQMGALAGDPGSAAAAQAAALAALAPMMAAAAAAEQANLAAQANLSAPLAAASLAAARGAGAHEEAPRSKKSKTSHDARDSSVARRTKDSFSDAKDTKTPNAHTPSTTKREQKDGTTNSDDDNDDDDRYTVAGITLASRAASQIVWAKLPGHPFWPGIKVNLDPGTRDVVPPETLAMRKEHESLVIFFGENSFGWVREDQVLDFKDAYAEKAREPIRNKARFNSALAEALRDVERRDDGFVPPAVNPRGRAGRHGRDDPKPAARDDATKPAPSQARDDAEKEAFDKEPNSTKSPEEKDAAASARGAADETAGTNARGGSRGGPGETAPAGLGSGGGGSGGGSRKSRGGAPVVDAAFEAKATAASALVAEATLAAAPEATPAGDARAAMRAVAAAADAAVAAGRIKTEACACRCCAEVGSQSVCLRVEAQRMCGTYPVGAMLALQGAGSVGNDIEIYWPLDEVHYVARVTSYDPAELQHMVTYEADGVREFLCLWKEDVKVLDGTEERHAKSGADAPSAPRAAHAVAGEAAEAPPAAGYPKPAGARADAEQSEDADAALLMGLQ